MLNSWTADIEWLTPGGRVLHEELSVPYLIKKFPQFYGTLKFITIVTRAHHLYKCSPRHPDPQPHQSTPSHPLYLRSILILPTQLCLGLPNGLFPPSFPTKTLDTFLLSPVYATAGVTFHTVMLFLTLMFWTYNLMFLTPSTLGNELYTNLKNILCFIGSSREDSFRLNMRSEEVT
jgi:hypothetical protein